MRSVVVAQSVKHAEAIIYWSKLDPDVWEAAAYHQRLVGRFEFAQLVRPHEEVTHEMLDWVLEELVPRVNGGAIVAIPTSWVLEPPPDVETYHLEPKSGTRRNSP